jgi:GxxExxY protein
MKTVLEMCDDIRQTSYEAHEYLGTGFLEKVYENALTHRLQKKGYSVKQQFPITVYDEDDYVIGEYAADIVVNDEIIVELKAATDLADKHAAQVMNYLKATRKRHAMLINFGSEKFQCRKFIR